VRLFRRRYVFFRRNIAWNLLTLGVVIALGRFVFFSGDTWGELAVDMGLAFACAFLAIFVVSRLARRTER
jgi:hypothetical protein